MEKSAPITKYMVCACLWRYSTKGALMAYTLNSMSNRENMFLKASYGYKADGMIMLMSIYSIMPYCYSSLYQMNTLIEWSIAFV